jgi:putative membrane protein
MKLRTLALAAALAPAIAFAHDSKQTNPPATDAMTGVPPVTSPVRADEKLSDARLASMLHHVNQMEIDAGQLAEKQGMSAEIKDFGHQLIFDHTQADLKLKDAARKAIIDIDTLTPADKAKLDVDERKMEQVKRMKGAEFDKAFASVMYNGHDDVLDMLDKHEGDIKSADLKHWVTEAKPVLKRHKDLANKLKGTNRAQGRTSR